MKKLILLFCFAVALLKGTGQVNKTWIGANNANWSVATNWSPSGVPGATDTVILSSTNYCNVDINPTIAAIRALGSTNSNGLTNNTGVSKTVTISSNPATSPVLYVEAGSNFTLGTFLSTSGVSITTYGAAGTTNTAKVDGLMNLAYTSTWDLTGGTTAATIVDVSSTGTIYLPSPHTAASVFLNSNTTRLRFFSGATLGWARNGGAIPAADYQNGSTINVTGVTSTMPAFSGSANYNGLLIWNCAGQTISGASAILLPTSSYSMDSIRVMSTNSGSLRMTTEPSGYTLGHLAVQGGTVEMGAPLLGFGTCNIMTDMQITGGTVYGNINNIGKATENPVTITISGNLSVTGGTLNLTNRPIITGLFGACQVNVAGNVTQSGAGTVTATYAYGSQNQLVLNGTGAQNLTMTTFSGPMALTINNSSTTAGVNLLSTTLTIPAAPAALVLANGVLFTSSSNLLVMSAGSFVSGGSNSTFVNGPVKKVGNTAFTFPVGSTSCGSSGTLRGYATLGISTFVGGAATDAFTAEYKRGNASALGSGTITATGLDHVSRCDYWTLSRDNGASTVDITLAWNGTINNCITTAPYVNSLADLVVAHNSNAGATSWDNYGTAGNNTGTAASGTVSWTGTQSGTFGAFALGSINFALNPLPISLNYLNGVKQSGAHYLNWKVTCNSSPSATMVLERSADGRNFTSINSITADAVRCQQPFDYTDNQPLNGSNYYRLKITDINGKVTYSSMIVLLNAATGFDIVGLYPTVISTNAVLNVTAAQKTKLSVLVTDIAGRQVQKIAYNLIAGSNQFTVNFAGLSAGTYQLTGYTEEGVSKTVRFVKQ
ncbi:T9SS type A sorting domain-containing protein [Ferruginibacter sp.]